MWHLDAPARLRGGWRTTYWLSDGSLMDLSLCDDCLDAGEDLDAIWDIVTQGWLAMAPNAHNPWVAATTERGTFILGRAYEMRWHEVEGPFAGVLR